MDTSRERNSEPDNDIAAAPLSIGLASPSAFARARSFWGEVWVWPARAAVLAIILVCWQYLPTVGFLSSRYHVLNSFFISSPTAVARAIYGLVGGGSESPGGITIWPYLAPTMEATLIGATIGLILGLVAALILGSSQSLGRVFWPLVVLANAAPRIALIPIIIVIVGINVKASIVSVTLIVFFLVFFSAYTGAMSVPPAILETSQLLGASKGQITRQIRYRYALQWTFAVVPNAIALGLISAVATELLGGGFGIGSLMQTVTTNLDSAATFALVVILAFIGWLLTWLSEFVKRRVLHWV